MTKLEKYQQQHPNKKVPEQLFISFKYITSKPKISASSNQWNLQLLKTI